MIPKSVINQVKSGVKIEDVVSRYIHLETEGQNLFAHCPFHEDATPSFCVSPRKQIFHCFSCGRGGNVFQFLMEYKGMSFPQAVSSIAQDEGLSLSKYSHRYHKPVNKAKAALIRMYCKAAQLYHHILIDTKAGQPTLNFLEKRGMSKDIIDSESIGFAPKVPILETAFLGDSNLNANLLKHSQLFSQQSNGKFKDRFLGCVMFPIKNAYGKVIAFSSMKSSDHNHVSINISTPFGTQSLLCNLSNAKAGVRKEHALILFHGYASTVIASQAGVANNAGLLGNGLSRKQLREIGRLTQKVIICANGNPKEWPIIARIANRLKHARFNTSVLPMPKGMTPSRYCHKYGLKKFKHFMYNAPLMTATGFQLQVLKLSHDLTKEAGMNAYLSDAVKVISHVPSLVARDVYTNFLAKDCHVKVSTLRNAF